MKSIISKLFANEKKVRLEFCQNNLDRFLTDETFPLFEEFFRAKHVSMKEYKCLSECELCEKKPYAKINGEKVSAETPQDLFNKLKGTK